MGHAPGRELKSGEESSNVPHNAPIAVTNLVQESAAAELIVAATIKAVREVVGDVRQVGPDANVAEDCLQAAELEVHRILLGSRPTVEVNVLFLVGSAPSAPWLALSAGQTVLLFLRAVNESWAPVVPVGTALETLVHIPLAPVQSNRTQAVVHELEHIVLMADPANQAHLIRQAAVARCSLTGNADLARLADPVLRPPARRAAWVAIGLADRQIEALDHVLSLFREAAQPDLESIRNLVAQKVSEIRDSRARAQLAELVRSTQPTLAVAAARALRQLQDPLSAPDLVTALQHPVQEVRYQAVMGLAELRPDVEAGPALDLFRENEAYYRQRWQTWWSNRRRNM